MLVRFWTHFIYWKVITLKSSTKSVPLSSGFRSFYTVNNFRLNEPGRFSSLNKTTQPETCKPRVYHGAVIIKTRCSCSYTGASLLFTVFIAPQLSHNLNRLPRNHSASDSVRSFTSLTKRHRSLALSSLTERSLIGRKASAAASRLLCGYQADGSSRRKDLTKDSGTQARY